MTARFQRVLQRLCDAQVEFVLIGGLAVVAHGHLRTTVDVDLCYGRTPENLHRLVTALAPLAPRLRGAPAELPFFFDFHTLKNGLNFTLTTAAGDVDLLGEVAGLGGYGDVVLDAVEVELHGAHLRILSLDDLIRSKAAAGRAKDLIDLEALRRIKMKR